MNVLLAMNYLTVLAQAGTGGGGGFPMIDTLIVLAGIGGAGVAICRSANRR